MPATGESRTQAAAVQTRVVADCAAPGAVRPARIVLTCADGNDRYRHLRWRSWGRSKARAVGQESVNNCRPSCAGGTFHAYAVRIRLNRVRIVDGQRLFRRVAFRFTGAQKPPGTPWRANRPLPTFP